MTTDHALRAETELLREDRDRLGLLVARLALLRHDPAMPRQLVTQMVRLIDGQALPLPLELTSPEWDELVYAAAEAEGTVDPIASIYESLQHVLAAVLPLHERMIRERVGGEVVRLRAENAELEQALGVPA